MSITSIYDFHPNRVQAEILVTEPDQIIAVPIYLLNDAADWTVTWQIVGAPNAVFEDNGIVFTELPAEGFKVVDPGRFDPQNPTRWIAVCNNVAKVPAIARYCVSINIDGHLVQTTVDPSIAVTCEPIPTSGDGKAGLAP
jgi:hypothetical protein